MPVEPDQSVRSDDLSVLEAACERIAPGGWDAGVRRHLAERMRAEPEGVAAGVHRLVDLLRWWAGEAGAPYADLAPHEQDRFLHRCDGDPGHAADRDLLVRLVQEGYYGGPAESDPPSWRMLNYRTLPADAVPVEPAIVATISPTALREHYDVVVIGSGAGGGVVAYELARTGASVLIVERAAPVSNAQLRGDHLRDKRTASYEVRVGPGPGHPRVIEDPNGVPAIVDGNGSGDDWGLNAMALGGGTRVWQGMAWRFYAEDFAMASTYGVPEGSSVVDWPFGYEELEPFYTRAEWGIGVSGAQGALTARTPRSLDYPMPPTPDDATRALLGAAADSLGWGWGPIPFTINTVPQDDRPACVRCGQCLGAACPVDAKNGTHNTVIARAVRDNDCEVLMSAQALEIITSGGHAVAVRMVVDTSDTPHERTVRCDRVVVAAGAIESPRLLMASGIGNEQVGRNLHAHTVALVTGRSALPTKDFRGLLGPGHSVATMDFVHRDKDAWGGGVLFDMPAQLPLMAARLAPTIGGPRWGAAHTRWMVEELPHLIGTFSIGQELPSTRSFVTIDRDVRDRHGMAVARIHREMHPTSSDIERYLTARCHEWLAATGATDLVDALAATRSGPHQPASEHAVGTVRMGEDPRTSAADRWGKVHGTDNVYVCDSSLHPSNGSVNPTLTIFANAYRIGEHLASLG